MKFSLIFFIIFGTTSYCFNKHRKETNQWGLNLNEYFDALQMKPITRQNPIKSSSSKRRKYRQMSIDNNIEILKEKLITSLLIRRQLQYQGNRSGSGTNVLLFNR